MPLNPYFLNGSSSEQRLIQDLINEQLKMFGQDIVYMPRKFINEKKIIKEILVSKFDDSFLLEAYVANVDGFGGSGDILSKFGVRSTDEVTFIISRERYEDFITPFISGQSDVILSTRPQEGDLIYFPLDNGLFEIKYVEAKKPFYQLNNLYVYELRCELFEYEDEIIDTGLHEVDSTVQDFGYTITLNMVSEGSVGSRAITEPAVNFSPYTQTGKSVQYIDIIDGGYGYKSIPKIDISNPPNNGVVATAVAIMTSRGNSTTIDKILMVNPGFGYTVPPTITVKSNSGKGFIGTSVLSSGSLGPITILDGGSEYSTTPTVAITSSSTGNFAELVPFLNSKGNVSAIYYANSGSGYTSNPSISISSPTGITTGNYIFNEIVRGVSTGTSAYVKDWDFDTKILKLAIVDGKFAAGEIVVGYGATYKIESIEDYDLYDKYASNEEIEEEADQILDFSEKNPFGEF